MKLRYKVDLHAIIIPGIILIALNIFILSYMKKYYLNQVLEENQKITEYIAEKIDCYLDLKAQVVKDLAGSDDIIRFLNVINVREQDLFMENPAYNFFRNTIGNISKNDENIQYLYVGSPRTKTIYSFEKLYIPPEFDATERPWYEGAVKSGGLYFAEPYISKNEAKTLVTSVSFPVRDGEGNIIGVAASDLTIDFIREYFRENTLGVSGYLFLTTCEGKFIIHPDLSYIEKGMTIDKVTEQLNEISSNYLNNAKGMELFDKGKQILFYKALPDKSMKLGMVIEKNELLESVNTLGYLISISIFLGIVFILIIINYLMQRFVVDPIIKLSDTSKKITEEKNYSINISHRPNDEIGTLYSNFELMMQTIALKEFELTNTKTLLINILQSMPSLLIAIDSSGNVTQWNHAAEIYTNVKSNEIIGKNLWEKTVFFDEFKSDFHQIIEKKEPLFFNRKKMTVKKEERFMNISLFPLIASGERGLVLRMDDVTELERTDEQLRQIQKMETIGTLSSGLAHDFNNILAGIVGTVSLLKLRQESAGPIDKKEFKELLETLDDSSKKAVDIVSRLLALSRKKHFNYETFDLNTVLKNIVRICENTFEKSVFIKSFYYDQPALISGDASQIEQVFLNIMVNAYHSMTLMRKKNEKKGGDLILKVNLFRGDKHFQANHPQSEERDYWEVSIRDKGIGIDREMLQKIFDPFFTTKEKGKGTGLGLSIAYNIIQQHKGLIDVYSEIGRGTTFTVYLPVFHDENYVEKRTNEIPIPKGHGTILIADDEPVVCQISRKILEECGYDVLLAENGNECIEIYQKEKNRVQLVILDLIMPGKAGRETFFELKKINPDIKILLSSGFIHDERIDDLVSKGLKNFIQKPYNLETLANAVAHILNQT